MNPALAFLRDLIDVELQVVDAIDILAVAVLIYALLALLRGTRAMQMLWGLVAITAVYLIATALHLITLKNILGKFLAFLPFAIIVLFQQEIRRMLTAFGSTSWTRVLATNDEGPVMVNELALAAQSLSAKRIGALIVVERSDSMSGWAETGIKLDAEFSFDLLLSVFNPTAPLHDGAVIVRGHTIAAAGCFLPLTTRTELSTEAGTRHRAAIGLSEETDAAVIVVSEETGTISLAIEGQLLRPLDETTLRNALIECLHRMNTPERSP